ncbi:glycerol-3-phosphate dehydrogenase [Sphingobacterium sp. DK4209]|uniref:Glycerol-3-phosphate dehydrogenase n=1 Tax=Sphingobacterium zhuxiongii TaxID=2662364 RepID=A0A5Q0QFZ3_9SPHI|nr:MULTISPECIES: NAD(P)H-dependent glycerol-3-phosphate dehydrogenase [unclassified Sphingobacterium]MVZ66584.1 glycerol-3-phosphate dehydrogenase [Sphingobacterium sp. DK4209]QGA26768.1 glycerol-3-phosphate dehydrogenase [Sphingobacterium sp. dk4302]
MSEQKTKIGVIGSGSWATAMIKMLTDNHKDKVINWWVRKQEDIDYIKSYQHNPSYLSAVEIKLAESSLFIDAKAVIQQSDIVILNTPAAYLEDALEGLTLEDMQGKIIVSAIKGIIPSLKEIVGEYLVDKYAVSTDDIIVVGGPCHAEEVSLEKLSYLTFASKNTANAAFVAQFFQTHYIKTVISNDAIGVEYGAVLKNIYALAGGICHGIGYGDNFQAVLISNAIREMEYFVDAIEPQDREINNSGYLGDLLVTAYSQFSRNRTFGTMIGKGYSVKSAQLEMNMVAEGYFASDCIQEIINRHHLQMPICNTVYDILYKNKSAVLAVKELADKLS